MRVAVAVTGASGIIYGARLIEVMDDLGLEVESLYTKTALEVADNEYPGGREALLRLLGEHSVHVYRDDDLGSPLASSSSSPDAMVVAPCSMKTLASIAHGFTLGLVTRAADAMLRLRRPLILVPRETPLGITGLRNMLLAAEAGAVILPAMPGFYHKPRRIEDLVDFIVGKILDVLGLENNLYSRWDGKPS